jgi:hypothetical protein
MDGMEISFTWPAWYLDKDGNPVAHAAKRAYEGGPLRVNLPVLFLIPATPWGWSKSADYPDIGATASPVPYSYVDYDEADEEFGNPPQKFHYVIWNWYAQIRPDPYTMPNVYMYYTLAYINDYPGGPRYIHNSFMVTDVSTGCFIAWDFLAWDAEKSCTNARGDDLCPWIPGRYRQ